MITKEQLVEHLDKDGDVSVGPWWFNKKYMCCSYEDCCNDSFDSTKEAAEAILRHARSDTSDIDLLA